MSKTMKKIIGDPAIAALVTPNACTLYVSPDIERTIPLPAEICAGDELLIIPICDLDGGPSAGDMVVTGTEEKGTYFGRWPECGGEPAGVVRATLPRVLVDNWRPHREITRAQFERLRELRRLHRIRLRELDKVEREACKITGEDWERGPRTNDWLWPGGPGGNTWAMCRELNITVTK